MLIKYTGKYVNICFIMKITFSNILHIATGHSRSGKVPDPNAELLPRGTGSDTSLRCDE